MTTSPAPRHDWNDELADSARTTLAACAHDPDEHRELGLMLGLFENDPYGSLVETNPLDDFPEDLASRSLNG
ncbi:hypothetical protein [Streptomyces sp. NPDC007083]|uniref:hypothetical protein n=1 Tax=Streptomyces sp. NPDC007083 TaxID=3156913 RepID=UPI0033D7A5C6